MAEMTVENATIQGETHDVDAWRLVIDCNADGTFQDAEIHGNIAFLGKKYQVLKKFTQAQMVAAYGNISPAPSLTAAQTYQLIKALMLELVRLQIDES